jgi:RNA polymerase sigma-70 factor, ECF subfamily
MKGLKRGVPPKGVSDVEERPVIEQFLTTRTEEAFCALFEAVGVRVHRYFLLRRLDRATAEELTQNVMLKVYRRTGELREANLFYGWLFAIARNELVSFWRGQQARIETVAWDSLAAEDLGYWQSAYDMTADLRLTEWLKALTPAERELVVLRFVEGLSYEELAEVFGLPLGTLKWRIFNVRKKLAQIIQGSTEMTARQRIN